MTQTVLLTIDFELTGYESSELAKQFISNTQRLLQSLKDSQSQATFFCVGNTLTEYPELIQEIAENGHEIGCHGWTHVPLEKLSPSQLDQDLNTFLNEAEKLSLGKIHGYRAPFFSLTPETDWAKDVIKQQGFSYDSSLLPCPTLLYGYPSSPRKPHCLENGLLEIPVTIWQPLSYLGIKLGIPGLGGTYLRLYPKLFLAFLHHHLKAKNTMLMPYCHPYDFDASLKTIQAFESNAFYNFLLGLGRNTMQSKIDKLIQGAKTQTIQAWINNNREVFQ